MKQIIQKRGARGFALVVTLSLMILLTVIAVGLLTLSSISLRSSAQGNAMATARSNARLAAMLALGELQKSAGPDKRITAPANLVDATATPGVTGVWKSWRPPSTNPDYAAAKTGDNFLGYLISNPNPSDKPDPKTVSSAAGKTQKLVGPGSVGTTDPKRELNAPTIGVAGGKSNAPSGTLSWAVLDEGMKSTIDLVPAKDAASFGESLTRVGAPARNGFDDVANLKFLDGDNANLGEVLPKLVSLNQANLAAANTSAITPYFHDFTAGSATVQSDVANGGLKTDLSVLFDAATLPTDFGSRYLYSGTNTAMGASDPLWALYADYSKLYRKTDTNDNPKDGFKAVVPSRYGLNTVLDKTINANRHEPNMSRIKTAMLMPTVVRVDTVFSLVARESSKDRTKPAEGLLYELHLMYLPVVTLHNPYNVPLRVTGLHVEFSDIPMAFQFFVNGQAANSGTELTSLNDLYIGGSKKKTFGLTLSNSLTAATEVVMGAGETRIFGKPFSPDASFAKEGGKMFDWANGLTGNAKIMTGIITGPKDAVGFDVDWLAPANRQSWLVQRANGMAVGGGMIFLKADDKISVRYGPKPPTTANNKFSVSVKLVPPAGDPTSTPAIGITQVFYEDQARLTEIVQEGTSPRFKDKRKFPATYPSPGIDPAITTMSILEANSTPVSNYSKVKPFAIFSLSGKTTVESFTKSRPVADTGIAMQMATCDFTSSASQGSSPLEFALVPVQGGANVIESDQQKGFFFGGHGTVNGTTSAPIYEVPMAPFQSIAQLRHVNAASIGSIPYVAYSVGESRAHPALPADSTVFKPDASRTVLDHSWLANDQLWDRYWFSSLATLEGPMFTGASAAKLKDLATDFYTGTRQLPNARNIAFNSSGMSTNDIVADVINPNGRQSAAHLLTAGGFNVNSTSVAAWTSVLSALADTEVPVSETLTESNSSGAPFLRMRQMTGASNSPSAKDAFWKRYRSLETAEIKELAEKIVAEVRARGPFLSMSEFVNRRLAPAGELSGKGALQAAIDKSGFNKVMEGNAVPVSPGEVAAFGWKNPDAVTGNTGAGATGEISQGDILSTIGSFATVRSDTFKIRAYGDAKDAGGNVIARAWCEMTVQRVPAYVDSSDLPAAVATAPANINFGRRFSIVSFRWLSANEV